jgi:DNA replication protein DnaC
MKESADLSERNFQSAMRRFLPGIEQTPSQEASCERHGAYISHGLKLSRGSAVQTGCPACTAEQDQQIEKARLSMLRLQRAASAIETLANAGVRQPRNLTFEAFVAANPSQQAALDACRSLTEAVRSGVAAGQGLVLSGNVGIGKTMLAAATCQALPECVTMFVSAVQLIGMVRDSRDGDEYAERAARLSLRAELLVIDDLGSQYGSESEQIELARVLCHRHDAGLSVIITTNENRRGVLRLIGPRAFDRLRERSSWISMEGESMRAKLKGKST